jgi:DeoR/GlpR family transcriptional regulator of sugar metabolism
MLTDQRKRHILDLLKRDGQVIAKDLSAALGLSEDTIRRDLRELAAAGQLLRVHGGALPASPAVADLTGRRLIATGAKAAIGRAAAALVRPGQVIILDGGTTTREVARHLAPDLRATVVTHSPTIAAELEGLAGIDVLVIGGRLFRHSMVTVGAIAIEAIQRVRADVLFLGVTGVHAREGLTTADAEEAAVKRALIGRSAETIVLASPEKLGAVSPYLIAPVTEMTTLVTSAEVADAAVRPFEEAGVRVIRG